METDAFLNFLKNQLIPKLKKLAKQQACLAAMQQNSYTKRRIEKTHKEGCILVRGIYQNFPNNSINADDSYTKLLASSLSGGEIHFLSELFERFKKTGYYKDFKQQETSEDFDGECFKAAYTCMTDTHKCDNAEKIRLVHGWVFNTKIEQFMPHAWVEEGDEYVYDYTQAIGSRKVVLENFHTLARLDSRLMNKYTHNEMLSLAKETGNYGPWDQDLFDQNLLSQDEFIKRQATIG